MAASFIVLLGIALVILLISRKENRTSPLYRSVATFAVVVLADCILYFYFFFSDMILMSYAVKLQLRLLDYLIFGVIPFFWLRVIGHLAESDEKPRHLFLWAWILGIVGVFSGCIATCFMDEYYSFASNSASTVFIIEESLLTTLIVCVTGIYTIDFTKKTTSSRRCSYVSFVSIILCLWYILQQIIDSCLYLGFFVSAWAEGIPDATAPIVFLMGLATFLFLFREDFSPLYYLSDTTNSPTPLSDPLEISAAQHGLTVRELEVLRLVYEGKNNPEIADALFISRNTVKKHLQSIYKKVGVNNRIELIYIVNLKSQN